ncbi:MAG TPA: hypothetical protein PLM91_08610 [Bacillota bacterium]|nr:hypothetical protein [Bacillota bacterium]
MKHQLRTHLATALATLCLLAVSAGALGSSVTLLDGTTYDADLVGFFTFDGVDHFVFRLTDGYLMACPRSDVMLIQVSKSSMGSTQVGQQVPPPAIAIPSTPISGPLFELSGIWSADLNGFGGEIRIEQSGTTLSGSVFGDTLANGRVSPDGSVAFERIVGSGNQVYRGTVSRDASGNLIIEGTFDCNITGGKGLPWHAVLTKPSAGSPSAQLPTTQPSQPAVPPALEPSYLQAEREPNYNIASANPIAVNTNVTGAISTDGDIDMYKVTVTTHGTFHVTCTQPADFFMAILNEAGSQIAGGDLGSSGTTMVLNADVFEPGNYYILVRGYSGNIKSDTPYTLRAEFREARDAFEPNDNVNLASAVVSGRQFDSFIYRPGDIDYYSVSVSGPATIKVTSTQPADYYLSIVDSSGTKELYGGDLGSKGTNMLLEGDVYDPGTYYVVMRGYNKDIYEMHTPYTMTITVTHGGTDRFEPNDTPGQAAVPPLGQTFAAFISRPGDLDYYKVDIAGPSQVVAESDQPVDLHLSLIDRDGKTVLLGDDYGHPGNKMVLTHDIFQPGTYYVLMRGYNTNIYSMHTPYNMKITVKPALYDPAEPNNSANEAKSIQLGQPVTGVIATGTDEDWWQFTAPLLGKVRITCTQTADFRLRVVDATGKEITNQDLGNKGTLMDLTLQLTPLTRYYVVVQPYSSSCYNMFEAYQLIVGSAI